MEAQQDHQPTNSTTARPQQPADAPAASIPTETLAQILAASLEGLDPWARQKARMPFAGVCVAWYGAVEVGRELVVKDTKLAERRATSLLRGSAERRDRIRSLSIKVESDGDGRGQRIASLVSACRQLEAFQLLGIGPKLGTWSCHLGKPLTQALKGLSHLKSFEINSSNRLTITVPQFHGMLSDWPHLTTLLLPTISTYSWRHNDTSEPPPTILGELQLSLQVGHPNQALGSLLKLNESTLRHLDLGETRMTAGDLAQIAPEVKASLETIAPQLLTLKAVLDFRTWGVVQPFPSSDFLTSTLAALRDIKELAPGILGFPFATILSVLQALLYLRTLSIGNSQIDSQTLQAPFQQLTSQAAIDFINGAVALKSLALPHQMKQVWAKDELKRVKAAAKKRGVGFDFV